jgi:hypothetical protein
MSEEEGRAAGETTCEGGRGETTCECGGGETETWWGSWGGAGEQGRVWGLR